MTQDASNTGFPTNWTCPQCAFDNRPINILCGGTNQNLGCKAPKPGVTIHPSLIEAQTITKKLQEYLQKEFSTSAEALSAESLNSVLAGIEAILKSVIKSRNGNVDGQDLSAIFKVTLEAKLFSKSQGGYIEAHLLAAQKAMAENPGLSLNSEQKGMILKTIVSIVKNLANSVIPWVANGCHGRAPGEMHKGRRKGGRGRGRRRGRGRGRGRKKRPLKPPPGATLDPNDPKYNLCWAFFTKGSCKRAAKCKWSHIAPGQQGAGNTNTGNANTSMFGGNNNQPSNNTPNLFGNNSNAGVTIPPPNLGGGSTGTGFSFGGGAQKTSINFGNAL